MTKAKFECLSALVWVTDVPAALSFYTEKLGCTEEFACPNDEGETDAAIAAEYEAAGVEFVRNLTEQDWGTSCKITDPDGNWIMFSKYH